MKFIKKILTLLALCLSPSVAVGQIANSSEIQFSETTSGAKITGCKLSFQAIGKDSFGGGKDVIIWGEFGYVKGAWSFQIATANANKAAKYINANKFDSLESDPINYAYFKPVFCDKIGRLECKNSAKQEIEFHKSNFPNGAFVATYPSKNPIANAVNLGSGNVEVGFNRRRDANALKFILDFQSQKNASERMKFIQCASGLMTKFER